MKKILAVDDDQQILESISYVLKQEGYSPLIASNGISATNTLKKCQPDLILLDLRLPDVSGAEVCRTIKQNSLTKHIPIVLISANYDGEKVSKYALADDFLEKPFDIETLTKTIKKYID